MGALNYELLTGVPPFYGGNREQLFDTILKSDIRYPKYVTKGAKAFINALMNRNMEKRLGRNGADEVKNHPFFADIDWDKLAKREIKPPFVPKIRVNKDGALQTNNFDPEFTQMPVFSLENKSKLKEHRKFSGFTYDPAAGLAGADGAKALHEPGKKKTQPVGLGAISEDT